MCAGASFTGRVASAANLEITASTFTGCTCAAPAFGALCAATLLGTFSTPWTATAVTTSDIQIHGVDIDTALENHPAGGSCGTLVGQTLRITGTLSGARWLGNASHQVELTGATGLVGHSAFGLAALTLTGTITDQQESLSVTG